MSLAAQTTYMLVSIAYILVGLALTTSIIELIRRQYAQSWKKMQELTNRLQGNVKPTGICTVFYSGNILLYIEYVLPEICQTNRAN